LLAAQSAELAKSGAAQANVEETLRVEIGRLNNEMQARTAALRNRRTNSTGSALKWPPCKIASCNRNDQCTQRKRSARNPPGQERSRGELSACATNCNKNRPLSQQQQAAMDDLGGVIAATSNNSKRICARYKNTSEDRRREAFESASAEMFLHKRLEELQSALEETELAALNRDEQRRQEYEIRAAALGREAAEGSAATMRLPGPPPRSSKRYAVKIDRLIGEARNAI
jgi:hypothetical protein